MWVRVPLPQLIHKTVMETIEARVAQTVLQKPVEITVAGKTYSVAPPSIATLILVSEAVSRLPHIRLDKDKLVEESLSVAKDCGGLGDIAAILILGAKHVDDKVETERVVRRRRLWGLRVTEKTVKETKSAREKLSQELLEEASPREMYDTVARLLREMQLGDFFGLTTFLTEINLIRPTKVVTEATASGQ